MQTIDLKSREVFGDEGCGVAVLVNDPQLTIRQIGLEPGREIPSLKSEAPLILQALRGEGLLRTGEESTPLAPGGLTRIAAGTEAQIRNDGPEPFVFLLIGPPPQSETPAEGTFFNFIDFAPLKPGKEEAFLDWFRHSSEVFARHPGFLSRRLLRSIESGGGFAVAVEHESKETFMDMHLSDDRVDLFRMVEPLILGDSKPYFYETLISHRKK